MHAARAIAVTGLTALLIAGATVAVVGCGGNGTATTVAGGTAPPAPATPASGSATGLQDGFTRVVTAVSPRVVQVRTSVGLGSGVVFDTRGDIVTNAHVVGTSKRFEVTLAGGQKHSATLVGADRGHDLAVIRLVGARPSPATFGDSEGLKVGDIVLAMGNPLGLRSSVTQGIVSSLGRRVTESDGVTLTTIIQTSAAINPGNSGGALVDLNGRVVGIPTLAALDPEFGGAQANGIGFAIPSSMVSRVASRLIAAT